MLAPFEYGVAPSGWKATSLVIFPNTACNRQLRRRCQKFGPMWTKIAEVGVFAMLSYRITHGPRIARRLYLGFLEALLSTATISRLECSANHRFPQFLSIRERVFGIATSRRGRLGRRTASKATQRKGRSAERSFLQSQIRHEGRSGVASCHTARRIRWREASRPNPARQSASARTASIPHAPGRSR